MFGLCAGGWGVPGPSMSLHFEVFVSLSTSGLLSAPHYHPPWPPVSWFPLAQPPEVPTDAVCSPGHCVSEDGGPQRGVRRGCAINCVPWMNYRDLEKTRAEMTSETLARTEHKSRGVRCRSKQGGNVGHSETRPKLINRGSPSPHQIQH